MTTTTLRKATRRHELKLWTDQFVAMQLGAKRADVRRCDDREYRRGDEILYRDFTARSGEYSGIAMLARVTHLTRAAGMLDLFGRDMTPEADPKRLEAPVVVLSIEVLELGAYEALKTTAPGELPSQTVAVGGPAPTSTPMCYDIACRYYGQRHATPHEAPDAPAPATPAKKRTGAKR